MLSPSAASSDAGASLLLEFDGANTVELRPYQHAAITAVYDYLRDHDDNPCVVIPTAGGKTPVLATICKDAVTQWGGRVLVLAHVKELLQQAADKLQAICPQLQFGVYSAGLRRRDTEHPVIVAGIQSVYKRACELDAFDLIIVDEAHLIPPDGEGMYRQFLAEAKVVNPRVRTIGLTATPFRLKSGMICGPENILNAVCFEVGVRELIRDGYLCPLVTKAGRERANTDQLHVRAGEFVAEELEEAMDRDELVEAACAEIIEYTQDRHAVLIFASGVKHAQHIQRVLREIHHVECGFVCGATPDSERDELLARFRGDQPSGLFKWDPLKYLVNVNVLTTGFDAPRIDCVALLRPTLSPGLFYQQVGRGFRLWPGKKNCLVLDFGGNILRHGPVDQIRIKEESEGSKGGEPPAKECPECLSLIAAGYAVCPDCGYEFPAPDQAKHDATASAEGVLSGQVTETVYQVRDVYYCVHTKQNADEDAPKTMRVDYRVGLYQTKSEWICFEHTGFARHKAEVWWRHRSHDPIPATAQQAVDIASGGGLAATKSITVRTVAGEKFDRVVDYELGEKPEPLPLHQAMGYTDNEIPF
jgi:DNA repair protein RadD